MKTALYLSWLLLSSVMLCSCHYNYPSSTGTGTHSTATGVKYFEVNGYSPDWVYDGFSESRLIKHGSIKVLNAPEISKEKRKELETDQAEYFKQILVDTTGKYIGQSAPGVVFISPLYLFVDETEIANIHWQEYLFHIRKDSSITFYESQLPDTSVIRLNKADFYYRRDSEGDVIPEIKPITTYQYHPEYLFYPVVGISYEQAVNYCKWRSKVVTALVNSDPKAKHKVKITYRLPTEYEWEVIATVGYDKTEYPYSSGTRQTVNYKLNPKAAAFLSRKIKEHASVTKIKNDLEHTEVEDMVFNVKRPLPYFLQINTPNYIYSGKPQDYGLFNLIGNVAEMVSGRGTAKGGSWKDELEKSKITDRQLYTLPSDKVGFRCVCEIEKFNK